MGTDQYSTLTPKEKKAEEAVKSASPVPPKRKLTRKERKAKEAKEKKSDFEFLVYYNFIIIWLENLIDLQGTHVESFLSRIFWIIRAFILLIVALVLIIGMSVGAVIASVKIILIYAVLEAATVGVIYLINRENTVDHWAFKELKTDSIMRSYMFESQSGTNLLSAKQAYKRFEVLEANNIVKYVRL